ncbi:MAG: YraN family protein [Candidatus Dojkabacteria bacterium]
MNRVQRGRKAEEQVKAYLLEKGWKFIAQNAYNNKGEIDLIFVDGEYIVFVEVKSLTLASQYSIYETLTKKKKKHLWYSIQQWLADKNLSNRIWRLDFIGIIFNGETYKIEHLENIAL